MKVCLALQVIVGFLALSSTCFAEEYRLRCDSTNDHGSFPIILNVDATDSFINWIQNNDSGSFYPEGSPKSRFQSENDDSVYSSSDLRSDPDIHQNCLMNVQQFVHLDGDKIGFGEHSVSTIPCGDAHDLSRGVSGIFDIQTKDATYSIDKTTGIAQLWGGTYQCQLWNCNVVP